MSRGVSRGDTRLFVDDAEALRDNSNGVLKVAPVAQSRQQVTYLRWNAQDDLIGTWPDYFDVQNFTLAEGRYFTLGEVQGKRRVAVLGSEVPVQLGTPANLLIGQTIQIRGVPFEVVGVVEEKGSMGFSRPDDDIFIPLSTAQYRVSGGGDQLSTIYAEVAEGESLVLCVLGGVFGVAVGFGGARLLTDMMGWETLIRPATVGIALVFSAGIGLFFGIMPARRAARLNPIDALRYE